ncbi:aquaporin [Rhodococcus sp. BP-349]|uniref:aquaporin n=1 Tax=unclassified Rhodococcus (in: high G+C Gram-positive bacteria) TaxID=192944 RepID=UPI001C9B86EB|nr:MULTISPECIES: aquaporin [unclassified Rhodococcus (in: high G+C Gram-positive bacteria)]MBY6540439.1 aquaporin [Rhodococcus sp. BP-363]MBY6545536.1 aquaporin [Rhodococcus sp. BP-369]MBY6564766.1 aquaporin [Rhodococcus sp. BP-370]MBY6578298.1 aquaporin [Rhodococcus sp. BP-364]MBY6587599.1 aquaporin [Rhodococcus sp. BP-358]
MTKFTVYIAEAIGTAVLVIGGVGTAVLAGDDVGTTGIALAFGLTLLAMVFVLGPVSGCHINPAVTLAFLVTGRMTAARAAGYAVAQVIGGLVGALVVYAVATGRPGYDRTVDGLGANGYGDASAGNYLLLAVAIVEIVATAVLVLVVLGVTGPHSVAAAGVPIGLTLTFVHLLAIGVDSTSVNPARSIGPALIAGGSALSQLWVFLVFPLIGGLVGALAYKAVRPAEAVAAH